MADPGSPPDPALLFGPGVAQIKALSSMAHQTLNNDRLARVSPAHAPLRLLTHP